MAREIEFDMRLFSGLPVTIQGGYSFGHPGQVSGPPEACFPPEPSEFEFTVYWRGKPKDKKLLPVQQGPFSRRRGEGLP